MPHAQLNLHQPTGDKFKMTPPHVGACRCGIRVHLKQRRVDAHALQRSDVRGRIQRDSDANVWRHRTEQRMRGAWQ